MKHPLDHRDACPRCGQSHPLEYNGAQLIRDEESLREWQLFTCGGCGTTFTKNPVVACSGHDMQVTDRREWGALRIARQRGLEMNP